MNEKKKQGKWERGGEEKKKEGQEGAQTFILKERRATEEWGRTRKKYKKQRKGIRKKEKEGEIYIQKNRKNWCKERNGG